MPSPKLPRTPLEGPVTTEYVSVSPLSTSTVPLIVILLVSSSLKVSVWSDVIGASLVFNIVIVTVPSAELEAVPSLTE